MACLAFLVHAELACCFNLLPRHLETSKRGFALVTCSLPAVSILASYATIATDLFVIKTENTHLLATYFFINAVTGLWGEICCFWGVLMPLWSKIHTKYPQHVWFNSDRGPLLHVTPSKKVTCCQFCSLVNPDKAAFIL